MVEQFDNHDQDNSDWITEHEDLAHRAHADDDQHAVTFDAIRRIGVDVGELWLYYLSMGGGVDEYEVDAYLHGLMRLPAVERDMISQAVNEMIDDICRGPRAPYSASSNRDHSGTDTDMTAEPDTGAGIGIASGISRDTSIGRTTRKEPVLSLAYSSTATRSFDDQDLADLLVQSRRANRSSHLTGLLLYHRGRFLQVLEGPEEIVRDRMDIIKTDPRHTRVRVLVEETRDQRHFPDWTMGYEPISATMTKDVPGYDKPFADTEDDADPVDTLGVLHNLIRWFQDHAVPLR